MAAASEREGQAPLGAQASPDRLAAAIWPQRGAPTSSE